MRSGGTRLVRTAALAAAILAPCAGFAACGSDQGGGGDASSVDVTNGDAVGSDVAVDSPPDVVFDNYVPPACATLDASCLGAAIPSGWVPVGLVANAAPGCPGSSTDFDQRDWVTNPTLHAGACQCGACTMSGPWTCTGQVTVSTGNNGCSTSNDVFTAGPHCTTSITTGGNSQIAGSLPSVGGNVTCNASVAGNGQVDTTPVRTCQPLQCTTDYCSLAKQGFSLCILYNGPAGCPSGFYPGLVANNTTPGKLDVSQNAAANCSTCTCAVEDAGTTCSAVLRTFRSSNCDGDGGTGGTGFMASYAAQGSNSCIPVNSPSLASVFYLPTAPDAGCTNTSTGSGTASLKAPVTVCCVP